MINVFLLMIWLIEPSAVAEVTDRSSKPDRFRIG